MYRVSQIEKDFGEDKELITFLSSSSMMNSVVKWETWYFHLLSSYIFVTAAKSENLGHTVQMKRSMSIASIILTFQEKIDGNWRKLVFLFRLPLWGHFQEKIWKWGLILYSAITAYSPNRTGDRLRLDHYNIWFARPQFAIT